jgi:hypothetical protein
MDHEHIMGSFPDLFPYAGAALGDGNGDSIDLLDGVKWLLAYKDGQFARSQPLVNALFQCVMDGRLTRAVEKLIRDHYQNWTYNIVSDITVDNILAAATEEDRNNKYSDDRFTWLAKNSLSICSAIPGTIWSWASVRNVVFSMVTKFGTPSILLSFTLAMDNNPVINLVNGSSVDYNLMQEDKEDGRFIMDHLFLLVKMMSLMAIVTLEELLGIQVGQSRIIECEEGIFGEVNAYMAAIRKNMYSYMC